MRYAWALAGFIGAAVARDVSAQAAPDAAVQNQWFTGSLAAPSPALPKAGLLALEPYVIFTSYAGEYGRGGGNHSAPDAGSQLASVTVLKYGITDRLSIEALPSISHPANDQTSATGIGDLPVEFEYRFNNENNKTGLPSVTTELGMTFPTGDYDGLRAPFDGLGTGAYVAKEGLLLQSLFDTWNHHPLRLRLYGAAFEPVANVSVRDISVYGTGPGFQGRIAPGASAEVGLGAGYGLNQRWVLALDVIRNYADRFRLNGTDSLDTAIHTTGTSSSTFLLAPAIEYNWSGRVGVIFGVEFSAAGHNTSSYLAPQIALSTSL